MLSSPEAQNAPQGGGDYGCHMTHKEARSVEGPAGTMRERCDGLSDSEGGRAAVKDPTPPAGEAPACFCPFSPFLSPANPGPRWTPRSRPPGGPQGPDHNDANHLSRCPETGRGPEKGQKGRAGPRTGTLSGMPGTALQARSLTADSAGASLGR